MQPGKGPKVVVVEPFLTDSYGREITGHYNSLYNTLMVSGSWARGLEAAQLPVTIKATGLMMLITTFHEFVHYGRAANGLDSDRLPNGEEAGIRFVKSISPIGDEYIRKNTAIKWIEFYKF